MDTGSPKQILPKLNSKILAEDSDESVSSKSKQIIKRFKTTRSKKAYFCTQSRERQRTIPDFHKFHQLKKKMRLKFRKEELSNLKCTSCIGKQWE